jgi:8-oxo-dGTP pyrophosphatase MutT (NUDIX family)
VPDPGDEPVDVVDESDRVIGTVPRREIRSRNLLHRCTYVLVRRSDGRINVHRRTDTKDVDPGAYDMFPGGVCAAGESYDDCARRELEEELGIAGAPLRPLFRHRYSGPDGETWGGVYEVTWDGPVAMQPEEVAWNAWVTAAELDRMLDELTFCRDSREIYRRWRRT